MIKSRPEDFRVSERLVEDYVRARGEHAVYRVTKRKLTSLQAAAALAELSSTVAGEIGMAGLKDRQGVTVQHMSVHRGRPVQLHTPTLKIEPIGFADEKLESRHSEGNSFDIKVRGVRPRELERLRDEIIVAGSTGIPNYFDEQRFGNLRHGEGWIVLDLFAGRVEQALRRLVLGGLPRGDEWRRKLAVALERNWGNWRECREISGKLGRHHSVFEHLSREPRDFVGALEHVSTRVKLIHLYAFQSHLWNRAVAQLIEDRWARTDHIGVPGIEGWLVFPTTVPVGDPPPVSFRLPGPGLADVADAEQRRLLSEALAMHRLEPARFRIEGLAGFGLKGEDRALWLRPRIAPLRGEKEGPGLAVRLRFDLPRGAYATVVVKRLLARLPRLLGELEIRGRPRTDGPREGFGERERGPRRPPPPRRGGRGAWSDER